MKKNKMEKIEMEKIETEKITCDVLHLKDLFGIDSRYMRALMLATSIAKNEKLVKNKTIENITYLKDTTISYNKKGEVVRGDLAFNTEIFGILFKKGKGVVFENGVFLGGYLAEDCMIGNKKCKAGAYTEYYKPPWFACRCLGWYQEN